MGFKKNSSNYCSANFIVISMIPVLFLASMIAGYLGMIHLNVPIHSLVVIGFILFIFLLFIKHNANYSICKMRSDYLTMEMNLKDKLASNLLTIDNQSKSILNIDEFLQKYYADIRNDNFVSVASSIFPMLGILGTFVAIAISMPNFSVSDTKALDNEISILLSGIGSAFFASIYGILLSLIWTYFEKRGLSKVDRYFQEINTKFESKIWSKEELTINDHRQKSILKETFNLDFIKELNKLQLDSFKEIMNETNKGFINISKNMNEASKNIQTSSNSLNQTISQVDNADKSLDAHKEIQNSINEFTKATKSLNSSINVTFTKIDTEIGDIVIKLADFATHVSLESKEVQDSIAKYHQQIANSVK